MDDEKRQESGHMRITNLTPDSNNPEAMIEAIIAAMQDSGADEEAIRKTRKLMEAKFGIGSWQDVITLHEESLKAHEAQQNIDGQITTLISLTEFAINAGDKEKARDFVIKAEKLLATVTAVDIENSYPFSASGSGETVLQLRRAEIERLRNWVS